ncbi:Nicotinamidase-related amidase [Saccharopolyspora antimicrobica]|uniref:Nicotinamidase-related amidase n=1 Tax=Saccharopolyspora antimicrobica TaxID=455193 RepID=A0A1I4VMV9_9PSEU|nr:isochorismatase family protein [Saccharopolyspora antimicrobica]RKT87302.1 nicotinamidase-related amidase [Saccharopolyspora antimicrobica]SFN02459.1 Nicotinamidase-related amidase [Saccharopolyspora antimicrobica]
MLLIDHQSGLFQVVSDQSYRQARANAVALARLAALVDMPVITTASVPDGPNGPLIPEIHESAPKARYVACAGQVNAWDTPEFRQAVADTGKRSLIISGVITSVCVAEPAISALADGYTVYGVIDASGTYSKLSEELTVARMIQAGVVPIDTTAVISEVQKTWNRPEAAQFASIHASVMTNCQLLIESYQRVQAEATHGEAADAERKIFERVSG